MSSPVAVLLLLFAGPMAILVVYSFQDRGRTGTGAWTLFNYETVAQPFYWKVALDTLIIALWAMLVLLLIAYPLAYVIAFKSGKWEIPLLLMLVLSDELNPLIRIFAWKTVLGRKGVINTVLEWLNVIDEPIEWLLFTKFTVVVVLSVSWLPYTVLPIYAAMKTIDKELLEAAQDLGAGWWTIFRRILLPLTAAGFMATVIIVFIPILSDYAAPVLVGGTEGIMISAIIGEEFLARGQWGIGSALTFVLLAVSSVIVWLSYKLTNVKRLQT
jgi:spermidine/putrescine transport system permease protein